MLVVDTNVLVYAADADSPYRVPCRDWLERQRARADAWYTTWGILYEFVRVTTHPRVMPRPWVRPRQPAPVCGAPIRRWYRAANISQAYVPQRGLDGYPLEIHASERERGQRGYNIATGNRSPHAIEFFCPNYHDRISAVQCDTLRASLLGWERCFEDGNPTLVVRLTSYIKAIVQAFQRACRHNGVSVVHRQ